MRTSEEVAREASCEVSWNAAEDWICHSHETAWQDEDAWCPVAAEIIRARDSEVRAETLAQAERADPVLRAWVEPGINPPYHERMKARVRKIMPTLARHLDEKAKGIR